MAVAVQGATSPLGADVVVVLPASEDFRALAAGQMDRIGSIGVAIVAAQVEAGTYLLGRQLDGRRVMLHAGDPYAGLFHGEVDPVVPVAESRKAADAFRAAGATSMRYTEFLGAGHNVWDMTYGSPQFRDWLFAQRR